MSRRLGLWALMVPLAFATTAARAATAADTVVFAKQIDDIITLDPGECYELSGVEILTNVYDRLLRYEAEDNSSMVGGVAESWTVSADGKTFTFKIRPGLTFADGSKVTAEDAAFSLQRVAIMDKTPGFLLTQLGLTKANAKELIKATDPMTLQMTIVEPYAPSMVLNLMTSIVASVIEKKVALENEKDGDFGNTWLKTHSAGAGAYRLVSWKPNESVTLEANPTFRMGAPKIKRVVVRNIPEPASQMLLLEKGDVDIARNLTPDQLASIAGNKEMRVEQFAGANSWYLNLNQADERLAKPKVREALKYLVDYQGMVDSFLKGRFIVHQTFLPKGFFAATDYAPFKLDVAKAKALLAEAGYPDGFELRFDAPNTSPGTEMAQSIQQTMGQAGIKVSIVPAELKQVIGVFRARKHQMLLVSWGPDYFDPNTNADAFVSNADNSANSGHKLPAWRNGWDIPDLTKQTIAAAQELDTAKRAKMYADLQRTVADEGPYVFMFQNTEQVAYRAGVHGFNPGITEDLNFYRTITKK